jgi:hypothetical protein
VLLAAAVAGNAPTAKSLGAQVLYAADVNAAVHMLFNTAGCCGCWQFTHYKVIGSSTAVSRMCACCFVHAVPYCWLLLLLLLATHQLQSP